LNYLLDTCIISELTRPRPNGSVVSWLRAQDPDALYLSYLTIGELKKGIAKRGNDARAKKLERWLVDELFKTYGDRILPVARDESLIWGDICGAAERVGKARPAVDSLIAATALAHHMTLVTRNIDDMAGMGVSIFNPFGDE